MCKDSMRMLLHWQGGHWNKERTFGRGKNMQEKPKEAAGDARRFCFLGGQLSSCHASLHDQVKT
ncbi:hypothetical protein KSX_69200 [Ktedonospora formicarum]|uniref:Uncharacterized protein n=1 Tax=Ktedonospora formicarum TaxID=2778364 RepID=A0A8J3IA09_9CHLR|nr:hypothetical protein KSX_69200 [Ktedonospora formicarum]